MHDSSSERVTVESIVRGWVNVCSQVGFAPEGELSNPKTYIAVDSYYVSAASNSSVMLESRQPILCSVCPDPFKKHVSMVHPPGSFSGGHYWRLEGYLQRSNWRNVCISL